MWVISYDVHQPRMLARRFIVSDTVVLSTEEKLEARTLEELRRKLPSGMTRLDRDPRDDVNVIESWI